MKTTPVITLPSRQWVRLRGTRLELYNDCPEAKRITADLAGVHLAGIGVRICSRVDSDAVVIGIEHEEVNDQ